LLIFQVLFSSLPGFHGIIFIVLDDFSSNIILIHLSISLSSDLSWNRESLEILG